MRLFHWLCSTEIPSACDLRRCGWKLARDDQRREPDCSVALAHRAGMDHRAWTQFRQAFPRPWHDRVFLLGVEGSAERARLLGLGFGDVVGEAPGLNEIEARATRIALRANMLPRGRQVGPLRLDLVARDGFIRDKPLALHPREFALLWRLADTPGVAVAKRVLLTEVWRLCHLPDTNSLAVHIFRLRTKLAGAGLAGLVQTALSGGYMLAPDYEAGGPAIPLLASDPRIDDLVVAQSSPGATIFRS